MASHKAVQTETTEQDSRARIGGYIVWSALSCLTPVTVVVVSFLGGVFTATADEIAMVIGGIMFGVPYVILPPALCFFVFGIYFDGISHKVRTAQITKRKAMLRVVIWAVLLACLAGLVRGALPTTLSGFVEGAIALGLLPAVVAVVRVRGIKIE
ncbi:hypothetical protein [Populibacterium corticicola]|uniref:hypothetical protein n=1 Tax=Populibacterium corticicola TaxID=1812826 RepID=UPI0036700734